MIQACIMHLMRHNLNLYRKTVAADLRRLHGAATADMAATALDAFEAKWRAKYASIVLAWGWSWAERIPSFAFDPAVRKAMRRDASLIRPVGSTRISSLPEGQVHGRQQRPAGLQMRLSPSGKCRKPMARTASAMP